MSQNTLTRIESIVADCTTADEAAARLVDELEFSDAAAEALIEFAATETDKGLGLSSVYVGASNAGSVATSDDAARVAPQSTAVHADLDVYTGKLESGQPIGKYFYYLPILGTDPDHPKLPSLSFPYQFRRMRGSRSDVEVFTMMMRDGDYAVLIKGPAGCGKNTLIKFCAEGSQTPLINVNFGDGMTYQDLVGMYILEDGNLIWRDGLLLMAVRYGWWFCADEVNAAPPELTMPLHGVTQSKDDRHLTILELGKSIIPHENFRFVGTMNPNYAGTSEPNHAFMSRFFVMELDYIAEDQEVELVCFLENIQPAAARCVVRLANSLRRMVGDAIMTPITTREILKIAKLHDDGAFWELEDATTDVIINGASETDKSALTKRIESHDFDLDVYAEDDDVDDDDDVLDDEELGELF